jgi:hypothetical protein
MRGNGPLSRMLALGPFAACALLGLVAAWPQWGAVRPPIASAAEANAAWLASAPEGTLTRRSFNWRTAPLWKWSLGPGRGRRAQRWPGVDFSSDAPPLVVAVDPLSGFADPGYAGNDADFATSRTIGVRVVSGGGEFGFSAREGAAVFVDPAGAALPASPH